MEMVVGEILMWSINDLILKAIPYFYLTKYFINRGIPESVVIFKGWYF